MDGLTEPVASVVENSSIHNCNGICVNFYMAKLVELKQNVIYKGTKFLI